MDSSPIVRRALISVSDKSGLKEFASQLVAMGVQLLSTGGTQTFLQGCGLPSQEVSDYTAFPEMMGGRVKTLHPKIFGGILARRELESDVASMTAHGMESIDLVVVNLYPFRETVAQPDVTWEEAIEQIDIGGPSLIRAAAKNHRHVVVATRPEQYASIISEMKSNNGATSLGLRQRLAAECFAATAAYDAMIAHYFQTHEDEDAVKTHTEYPPQLQFQIQLASTLRYGENPHQSAAVYRLSEPCQGSLVQARQLHGKELSYNNLLDLDSALAIARAFQLPSAVVIKHNNPCGAATAHKLVWACRKALAGDPLSAFGGVIGFNAMVEADTAEVLCQPGLFIEAIVAPEFSQAAIDLLTTKPKWRDSVRLVAVGPLPPQPKQLTYRFITGGVLVQESDTLPARRSDWKVVTEVPIADELSEDIAFAWEMVRHVKSNAIVLANDAALVGVGAGQMSRVDSVKIAIQKAGDRSRGSILASDAFFPFADSIELAAAAGVVAVVQPGGSKKDNEVIAACNQHRIPMIFTQRRHFKH